MLLSLACPVCLSAGGIGMRRKEGQTSHQPRPSDMFSFRMMSLRGLGGKNGFLLLPLQEIVCARRIRLKVWRLHLRPGSCHGRIFVYVKSFLPLTKRDNCVHFRPARGNETQFRDGKNDYQGENAEREKTKKRMQQPEPFFFLQHCRAPLYST